MDRIVICVHPFIMRQEIDVYKDGQCVEHKECLVNDISDVCYSLCRKHNIHQVAYIGNEDFGKKIEEQINIYKYNNFDIQFDYY